LFTQQIFTPVIGLTLYQASTGMKKFLVLTYLLIWFGQVAQGQSKTIDRLSRELSVAKDDKTRIMLLSDMGYYYRLSKPDTAFILCRQALILAKKIKYAAGEANALSSIGSIYRMLGDIQSALFNQYESLRIAEKHGFKNELAKTYLGIGIVHSDIKDYDLAIKYVKRSIELYKSIKKPFLYNTALANLGEVYLRHNQLDSALHYLQIAHNNLYPNSRASAILPFSFSRLSMVYLKLKKYDLAYEYAQKAIELGKLDNNIRVQIKGNQITSEYYQSAKKIDAAIHHAQIAFDLSSSYGYKFDVLESSVLLANLYEQKDIRRAYYYAKFSKQLNDSIYGVDRVNALQKKIIEEQEIVREKEAKSLAAQNRLKQNILLAGLGLLGLIGFMLYRNNENGKKAKAFLENTLSELKSTQTQLIQSEKLASLGELTAGIAHEIQNPLNFVNNFAEVSAELLDEMNEELEKGDTDEAKAIAIDLKSNLTKIASHGKRASSIVKGMLEHSRSSSGVKEPTDLNQLAEEYLRLAYHGLRAKDSSFNVQFETDLDPRMPKIEVIPQDLSRVLLNLINNAFYASNERAKTDAALKPMVSISTRKLSDKQVEIRVQDNGNGIPEGIRDKIFQPFFTTKPTGQGTGLGLSLAYDIVTKGHGGELKVETTGEQGTLFSIRLPMN
jgi:signal transduction histidine kinase